MQWFFVLLLIAACSQTEVLRIGVDAFNKTEWALEEIGGQPVVDAVQLTLRFQGRDQIIGWGGCNRYFAGFRYRDDTIEIGPIGSTRRICPPVVMDQEVRYFEVLAKARHISMQGPYLVIESGGSEKSLKFVRLKNTGE